jgi:hypothetical protein
MAERLVDVMNRNGIVVHPYPIGIGGTDNAADDAAYEAKALEAAAHGQLAPVAELGRLTGRVHVSRGGQIAAFCDDTGGMSETKVGLEQVVRGLSPTSNALRRKGRPTSAMAR